MRYYVSADYNYTTMYYNFKTGLYQERLTAQCYTTVHANALAVLYLCHGSHPTLNAKV